MYVCVCVIFLHRYVHHGEISLDRVLEMFVQNNEK